MSTFTTMVLSILVETTYPILILRRPCSVLAAGFLVSAIPYFLLAADFLAAVFFLAAAFGAATTAAAFTAAAFFSGFASAALASWLIPSWRSREMVLMRARSRRRLRIFFK